MAVQADLLATLNGVAAALASTRDPWWIIGSAAVALHLDAPIEVADVDVLLSLADARHLLTLLGLMPGPGTPHPQFRSGLFATWRVNPLAVEFMADFQLKERNGWSRVRPTTRDPVRLGDMGIPVPSQPELKALLERIGRPKDLVHAAML